MHLTPRDDMRSSTSHGEDILLGSVWLMTFGRLHTASSGLGNLL